MRFKIAILSLFFAANWESFLIILSSRGSTWTLLKIHGWAYASVAEILSLGSYYNIFEIKSFASLDLSFQSSSIIFINQINILKTTFNIFTVKFKFAFLNLFIYFLISLTPERRISIIFL